MKRVYAAAALLVASGAAIGYFTAPHKPAPSAAAQAGAPKRDADAYAPHSSGGGGGGAMMASQMVAGPDRVDCFYLRVAYNSAIKPGADTGRAASAKAQAQDAGCWVDGGK